MDFEHPKGMEEFKTFFDLAHRHALEELIRRMEDEYAEREYTTEKEAPPSELQQAMALFMIDDLSGVTLAQVKEQRNRLIKMFHPDTGSDEDTRYAQKINAAYEVLKQYLS